MINTELCIDNFTKKSFRPVAKRMSSEMPLTGLYRTSVPYHSYIPRSQRTLKFTTAVRQKGGLRMVCRTDCPDISNFSGEMCLLTDCFIYHKDVQIRQIHLQQVSLLVRITCTSDEHMSCMKLARGIVMQSAHTWC